MLEKKKINEKQFTVRENSIEIKDKIGWVTSIETEKLFRF